MIVHSGTETPGFVALVTGGTQGIGAGISRRLLADGMRVVAVYRENDAVALEFSNSLKAAGQHAIVKSDVSAELGARRAMEFCRDCFHESPDILVNNAGVQPRPGELEQLEIEEWERSLSGNLWTAIQCCRLVVPNMRKKGFGRIINVSSVAATDGYVRGAQYSTAKSALSGLTVSLAREVARSGITVNCVLPAISRTRALDMLPEGMADRFISLIPTGRLIEPEDTAAAVSFLCSQGAGQITGQMLRVSGGR
jgi:NAD(P)-dependent dehydrogenase (short-subunit alcohol dehydrogenase family)